MPELPKGTVTFLFTDIQGSTPLWELHPAEMRESLAQHDDLLRRAIESHGGTIFKTVGDAFCAAFGSAADALCCAAAAQRELCTQKWPEPVSLQVRMALHTGIPEARDGDYFGDPVNRVNRLVSIAHGGQILVSRTTEDLVRGSHVPLKERSSSSPAEAKISLLPLGEVHLQGLTRREQVFQVVGIGLPANFPPLKSRELPPNNLPHALTSFIGREKDIEQVTEFLSKYRLVTLTGSGGNGKTRLAIQAAGELLMSFPDGAWFVDLATLTDPGLVVQTAALAVGLSEKNGVSWRQALVGALNRNHVLLILDNCEHVIQACAALAQALLQSCPALRILATSQEPLNISGEKTWRIQSLPQPKTEDLQVETAVSCESLLTYDSIRLFVERAAASGGEFIFSPGNARAVAQVCRRLDGIPLAIELAAARVKVLSPEQIAQRLSDRFRLLTAGTRNAPPRHQTLRAAIDWSFALLDPPERTLLSRTSVFAGGCSLEAAEAVCTGSGIEEWEILDLLAKLVDKSLVQVDEGGGFPRYRLQESLRQYGREKLAETGDETTWRMRHLRYYVGLAEEARKHLSGPNQSQWLNRLNADHDNIRAALDWCASDPEGSPLALKLAAAMRFFWSTRGFHREGRDRCVAALMLPSSDMNTNARADLLKSAGVLSRLLGEYDHARRYLEQGLQIAREIDDGACTVSLLSSLGNLCHVEGEYATARRFLQQALEVSSALGDTVGIAYGTISLGLNYYYTGDFAEATRLNEKALTELRRINDLAGIAYAQSNLACIALKQSDGTRALPSLLESLQIFYELGDRFGIAACMDGLGDEAVVGERAERAATLYGVSSSLFERLGVAPDAGDRRDTEKRIESIRAHLGAESFRQYWNVGRDLSLEEALRFAATDESAVGRDDE